MTSLRLVGDLDATFAWDGSKLYENTDFRPGGERPRYMRGAAATVQSKEPDTWRIVRDPLGLNKLFWAHADQTLLLAARPKRLVDEGVSFDGIWSIPRATVLDLHIGNDDMEAHELDPVRPLESGWVGLDRVAERVRSTLDRYLAAVASAHPSSPCFVCLSGGLDSSGIAAAAREHFPNLVAVTFDLERNGRPPSDDRRAAERLARDLRLPLLLAIVGEDELLDKINLVLTEAVDWRDFNVHAALVNAGLAEAIADSLDGTGAARPIVLTGDLANEFLVDYQAEHYRGVTYYALPRLNPARLRSSLVRGLDSCHREVGVFAAWRLSAVQPYAAAVDAYLSLSSDFLQRPDRKQALCEAIFGTRLPSYVYSRVKTRAQLGSVGGDAGVLGACIDRGVDGDYLRGRFTALHGIANGRSLNGFIRGGVYRSALPSSSRAQ